MATFTHVINPVGSVWSGVRTSNCVGIIFLQPSNGHGVQVNAMVTPPERESEDP